MNLHFDFTADKETKTIHITREFAADLDLVWDAFTKAEILVQWTAPKPLRAFIKEMDFREGGRCLTAMITPDNVYRWSLAEYIKIDPKTSFSSFPRLMRLAGILIFSSISPTRWTIISDDVA